MKMFMVERGKIVIADNDRHLPVYGGQELVRAFAESMKGLRKVSNLSMTALGKEIGVSQQTLLTYENCKRVPSLLQALTIAAFFGFTVEDMILSGLDMREVRVEDEFEFVPLRFSEGMK